MAKILVIDDDRMMRELYEAILTRSGYEVVLAENGAIGLASLGQRPDLIVVDLQMGDLNGYEFMKQLRSLDGQGATPVIASSGLATGEFALRAGADRFLQKPFHGHELVAIVEELLAERRPRE
jgi:DNA-binding response OmpR family regulator